VPALLDLVRVISTTTGTGTITLGSAVQGFLTEVLAGAVDGQIYSYAIEGSYVAAGDEFVASARETGIGTYTASGRTLTRTVQFSTNSNAALNLTGDQQVIITNLTSSLREKLTAARTYYVRTDGSNSNSGLVDSAGGAFLTIQKAIDVVAALDIATFNVTIQVRDGTYTGANTVTGPWIGSGNVTVLGNTGTPSNVVISVTGGNCFRATAGGRLQISGMRLTTTTSGDGVVVDTYGVVRATGPLNFHTCAWYHIDCVGGSFFSDGQNHTITGGAFCHYQCTAGVIRVENSTNTGSGTFSFGIAFALVNGSGSIMSSSSFTGGTITGTRHTIQGNSNIHTNGQSAATWFPGDVAGSHSTAPEWT